MAWWGGRSTWLTPPERTRSWPDAISSASWSCACRRIINDNRGASASIQEVRNMNIVRLYTGKDGQTHIEELDPTTHPELTTLQPTKGIVFRTTKPGHFSDWHNAPRRQFVITLAGEVEIGLGDGTVRRYGPGHVTLEDDHGTDPRARHHPLPAPVVQGQHDQPHQAAARRPAAPRGAAVAGGLASHDAGAVEHRRGREPLREASERPDPLLPKGPGRARRLPARLRAALGRRPVRELPGGLRAALLGAGLRLGRCAALEGSPRRELVGRAQGQDVHHHGPPGGRQAPGVRATERRDRHRVCLQAAAPFSGSRVHELGHVPGHRPEGIPLSGRAVHRELVRPLADRGPWRADDAFAGGEARGPDRARPARSAAVALLPGGRRGRAWAQQQPLARGGDRVVQLEPFLPGREALPDVSGRAVGQALLRGAA